MDAFLTWLDDHAGREAELTVLQGSGSRPITCVRYVDVPEPGSTVAATLGLSLAEENAGPELVMLVASTDPTWSLALGTVTQRLQMDVESLAEGSTVDFGADISTDSRMSAFVLTEPLLLDDGETSIVHTPAGHVMLLQAVPLFKSEMESLRSVSSDRVNEVRGLLKELGETIYKVDPPAIR